MTTTAWAHLPNAVHIDRVIASVQAHPEHWASPRDAAWESQSWDQLYAAWYAGHDILKGHGRYTEWNEAWEAARDVVWQATSADVVREAIEYAVLALVAYDDCAYMLDSDPTELATLAAFGDPRATMLFPACKVFHSLKTIA